MVMHMASVNVTHIHINRHMHIYTTLFVTPAQKHTHKKKHTWGLLSLAVVAINHLMASQQP